MEADYNSGTARVEAQGIRHRHYVHQQSKEQNISGSNINSDHDLLMMTTKLKLKQNLRSHRSRLKFNFEKLKDPEVADLFEATIGGKFAALNLLEENIDNRTENIHEER